MRKVVLQILLTVLLLLLVEGGARLILHYCYNRQLDAAAYSETNHALLPNHKSRQWGQSFQTDALGGRITARSPSRAKRTRVYLGDSVTMGVGVSDSSAFTYLLSQVDTVRNIHNPSFIGWSVADYHRWVQYNIASRAFTGDTIEAVVLCWCLNDVYGRQSVSQLPPVGNKGWLSKANAWLQQVATYKLLKLLLYQGSDHYYQYDLQFYKPNGELMKQALMQLQAMALTCAQQQISFKVMLLPYRSQLETDDYYPQQLLADSLQMRGIAAKVLHPLTDDAASLYLFGDEIHFSAAGHRALANEME